MEIIKGLKVHIWLLCLLSFAIIPGCNEEVPVFPIIEASLIEASADGALIKVSIENYPLSSAQSIGLIWNQADGDLNFNEGLSKELQASKFINGEATILISTLSRSTNYRFRAFLETDNNTFYSGIVTFLSLGSKPPVLESMTPETGSTGDTVNLIVKDFGIDSSANQVAFNESFGEVISRNDSLWKVIVPLLSPVDPFFETGEVEVFVTKYNLTSNRLPFELLNFNITGTLPETIKPGESYALRGEGFVESKTRVSFGESQVEVELVSENLIQFWVPSLFESATGTFTVTVGVMSKETNEVMIAAPTFDATNFTQTIGPGLPYEITGTNLDNPNIELLVNDIEVEITSRAPDRIIFTIPLELCAETVQIDARIRVGAKKLATELPFAAPEISNINVIDAAYGGKFEVSLKHFPASQSTNAYINEQRVSGRTTSQLSDGQITIEFEIPTYLILNDAGDLNFSYEICNKTITSNKFTQITPPEITSIATINPHQFANMTGRGFNGDQKGIYINDEKKEVTFRFTNGLTDDNLDTELGFLLGEQSNGTFDLSIEINGRRSENVSVTVENLWTTLARLSDATSLPQSREIHPVAFLNGDELYMGGGFDDFTEFHALDLNTGNWARKADIPMQIGGSSNNDTAGYFFYQQQLNRYDFALDTWERLPDLPAINTVFLNGYSTFMSGDRFFVSTYCLNMYYYNPATNEWQVVRDGGADPCSSALAFTTQTGEVYLHHYQNFQVFDSETLTYSGGWFRGFTDFGYRNSSVQGFEYEGNLILIDNSRLTVTAVEGSIFQSFGLPNSMNNPKLFRRGNEAIVVSQGIVWTFDLTAI